MNLKYLLTLIVVVLLLLVNVSYQVDPRVMAAEKIKSLRNTIKKDTDRKQFNKDFDAEKVIRNIQKKGNKVDKEDMPYDE